MRSAAAVQLARSLIFLWLFFLGYASILAGVGLVMASGSSAPGLRAAAVEPASGNGEKTRSEMSPPGVLSFKTISYRTVQAY